METIFEKEQISFQDILKLKVSFFEKKWSPPGKALSIGEVLEEIKSETHFMQVSFLRSLLNNNDKESYDIHKGTLSAVTFCGTFENTRKKDSLTNYNNLIVLDIDKLSNDELQRVKECLFNDDFVLTFWESPSKRGIKGLVHLLYPFELISANIDSAHKGAFKQLKKYFFDKYSIELDESGSDTPRLCFLSYDPNIVIKESFRSFEVSEADILKIVETKGKTVRTKEIHKSSRDALYNPKERNEPQQRKIIQAILKYLIKRNLSITHSYEEWYRVAFAIANSFTYEIGEKYFLKLSSLDKEKFNETNCKNMLVNCYEIQTGEIKFNTIVYLANQKGYQTKNQRKGSSEVANESLSQVSTSDNGSLPEVLNGDD